MKIQSVIYLFNAIELSILKESAILIYHNMDKSEKQYIDQKEKIDIKEFKSYTAKNDIFLMV